MNYVTFRTELPKLVAKEYKVDVNHWRNIVKKIKKAPKEPGVYIFYSKNEPIYVGKASNLRNRLKSYLARGDFKNDRLQENAVRLEFLPLRSEIEALLKESELIKKLNPPYNVLWRDDKTYFYVAFTKDRFQKIFVVHKTQLESRIWNLESGIGPFTEGRALRLVLRMLRRHFPYCTCHAAHLRTCLNMQIGNCPGFCCRKNVRPNREQVKQYQKNIRTIKNFLLGKPLKKQEPEAPTLAQREVGAPTAKRVGEKNALEKILAHREFLENFDFPSSTYYSLPTTYSLIEGYDISHLSGREAVSGMTAWSYDPAPVDSRDGADGGRLVPRKEFWRKFIIRTAKPADDPAAMRETVRRRLNHPEWPYPDIMIIDGGISQFKAAKEAVKNAGLDERIRVHSFAKPEALVYGPGEKPAPLKDAPSDLKKIIPEVVTQTHNFAIRFHRQRRKRNFLPKF